MFQIDIKSRKSIYEQVMDGIKELIRSGIVEPDEKLMSVRELSKSLMVNPNTVQKAYRELERQGYIYTSSGLGTFVKPLDDIPVDELMLQNTVEKIQDSIKALILQGMSENDIRKIWEDAFAKETDRKPGRAKKGESNDQSNRLD